jgi:REP element-mobilizing transposase RayT
MARPLRIEYPGAYYHVINRGNAGETIFKSNRDREKFLEYLATAAGRFAIVIHSYCLMPNHYHLLIETTEANLSAAIQWLNVSYATYFNRKRKRQGHLFQGRFKAILVEADGYLAQLSRYIHLNPVKAKMVEAPQDYPWSSYAFFVGEKETPEWLTTSLLTQFSSQRKPAIQNYRAFVEETDADTLENPNKQSVAGCILGDTSFVLWIQETFLSDGRDAKEIPQLKKLRTLIPPEKIVKTVAAATGSSPDAIVTKGRKRNQFREIAIYLALQFCALPCVELGRYFGGISGSAISLCGKRCAMKTEKDKALRGVIEKIRGQIVDS